MRDAKSDLNRPHFHIRLVIIAAAIALGACATPPQANDAANSIGAATLRIAQSVDEASADVVRLRRVHHFAEFLQKPGAPTNPALTDADIRNPYVRFGDFACEGIGAYAQQRVGLGTMARFSATVSELLEAPPTALGDLVASIDRHRGEIDGLRPAESANANPERICADKLARDLATILTDRSAYVFGFDPLTLLPLGDAVIESATALWNVLEKITVIVLQDVDRAARAEQLRKFLNHPDTLKALKAELGDCVEQKNADAAGQCADSIREPTNLCALNTGANRSTRRAAPAGFIPLGDAALQCILDERALLSAISPYFSYRTLRIAAFQEIEKPWSRAIAGQHAKAVAAILAEVPKLHAEMATYDRVRAARIPPGQHRALVLGIVELRRIANGELSPAEKLKAVRATAIRLAAAFRAMGDAIGTAKKGSSDLLDKLRALESALGAT